MTQKHPKGGPNFYDVKDPYFLEFAQKYPDLGAVLEKYSTSREVKANSDNISIAIGKNNNPYTYPDDNDEILFITKKYVKRYLVENCDFIQKPKTPGKEKVTFNGSSSSGLLGKKTGYPKTKNYIESNVFKKFCLNTEFLPVQIVNTKDEHLDIASDLSRNKIRLVDCDGKENIYKSKILYDNQNEALLNNNETSFIKYGMTKQYGGYDRLVTSFEGCSNIGQSDCTGYDKKAVFYDVYEIRNDCLILPETGSEQRSLYDGLIHCVTNGVLNPIRVLFDGTVILQDHSNSSGQNNTTTDNCILHLIICFYFGIYLFNKMHGRYPTYNELLELIHVAIYSDDKVLGLNGSIPFTPEELAEMEKLVYARFGMEIKASASKWFTHTPGELFKDGEIEFLGGACHWDDNIDGYLPVPRLGKLSTSCTRFLVETKEKLDVSDQFTKLVCILSLLVDPPDEFHNALSKFVYHIYSENPTMRFQFDDILSSFGYDAIEEVKVYKPSGIWSHQSGFNYSYKTIKRPVILNFFKSDKGKAVGFNKFLRKDMENDIPKIEKFIEKTTKDVGITPNGKTWMELSLDPFHDTPVRPVGFPDLVNGNSVVQVVTQSYSYAVPSGFAQDVHIFMDSVDTRVTMFSNPVFSDTAGARNYSWTTTATNGISERFRGGLCVRNSGTTGSGTTLSMSTGTNICGGIPDIYIGNSRVRVLAKAFEVVNTTPAIAAGGAVTVYRDSTSGAYNPCGVGNLYNSVNNSYNISAPLYPLPKVPETIGQVNLIPGNQTWKAIDGCYVVCMMNSQTNTPMDELTALLSFRDSSSAANTDFINAYNVAGSNIPYICVDNTVGAPRSVLISPYLVSGAYFTGLPAGTTLKITWRYIIERFVGEDNPDLVVMASPSPSLDNIALELYSKTAMQLPHGVPVDRNATGDWIKNIADMLATFGTPGMPLVKGAVDLYNAYMGSDKPKPKPKKKKQQQIASNSLPPQQRAWTQSASGPTTYGPIRDWNTNAVPKKAPARRKTKGK